MKKLSKKSKRSIRKMALMAVLSAMSTVLMILEFPMPILFPNFLKFDLSEVPIMIGAFAIGPLAGVAMEGVKILLRVLLMGTQTQYVGELANFLIGCAFVLPASLVYFRHKTRKTALIGLGLGIVCMVLTGIVLNYYLLLPFFSLMYHTPIDALVLGASLLLPYITDLWTCILFGIVPFNLMKSLVVSLIVLLVYKRVSPLIKGRDQESGCVAESSEIK